MLPSAATNMALCLNRIRLVLVDGHAVVRAGLRALLNHRNDVEVVGDSGTVTGALEVVDRLKPDMVLMEAQLPEGSGFEVCRRLHKFAPPVKVIILTAFADDDTVMQAIGSGAEGYLLKEIDEAGLVRAIKEVAEGRSILDPAVTRRVMNRAKDRSTPSPEGRLDRLSAQERRVLELVAQGKTNKEIGLAMNLSAKTVKNYLSNLMEKLKMNRRSQAGAFFVQHSSS